MPSRGVPKIETQFDTPGTLPPPGLAGRIARLLMGLLCTWPLIELWRHFESFLGDRLPHPSWLITIAIGLLLFPYVVNIGWGSNMKAWPRRIVVGVIAGGMLVAWLTAEAPWSPVLGVFVIAWIAYTFAHLGVSLILAALLATPGCEMRAIPHLWTRLTGRETREHYCPGPLDNIDAWERNRGKGR